MKLQEIQKNAEQLLEEVSKKEGVVEVKPGKLYIKTLKPGDGLLKVKSNDLVTVRYTSYVMEGEEDLPAPLSEPKTFYLTYCYPGIKEGMVGMSRGEIRRIYMHPELTHGKYGPLAPYGLNFFDFELISIEEN